MLPEQGNLKRECVQQKDKRQAQVCSTVFQKSDAKFETWGRYVPMKAEGLTGN
jgi:hypothetical protein